ncbi:MAG: acyl-CoA thioester hydrolase [Marinoscillum sp.]|jgi:acyl-CoA thioester hydrolase
MYQTGVQIRVRYAETDQMGYVYYGNYATYYEVARVEALRSLGFSYKALEQMGVGMPVLSLIVNYHAPAKYDDLLTLTVCIPEMPRARIQFNYELKNEQGVRLNTGSTELVFMNLATGRPVRLPKVMETLLQPHFI